MKPGALERFLAAHPPFDSLEPEVCAKIVSSATTAEYKPQAVIADGFRGQIEGLYVVLSGRAGLWNARSAIGHAPREYIQAGDAFGYSAILTGRTMGPLAEALTKATVALIPAVHVAAAFSSSSGAKYLAEQIALSAQMTPAQHDYAVVDELVVRDPIVVAPGVPVQDVARRMTDEGTPCCAVRLPDGSHGMVTDEILRARVTAAGLPSGTHAATVMRHPAPSIHSGESSAAALIRILDDDEPFLLVLGHSGAVKGAVTPADFAVSTATADVALRQQLGQADSAEELIERSRRLPKLVSDLLEQGHATSKVTAVYTATLDAVVRRALELVAAEHPWADLDDFTWLALGSVARGEAVLGSDIDSGVSCAGDPDKQLRADCRAMFGRADALLAGCGLTIDPHGASASRNAFARTGPQWRGAGLHWLDDPVKNQGAIMTSLLVDARPIHGDTGRRHLRKRPCVRTSCTAVRTHRPESPQRDRTRTDRRRSVLFWCQRLPLVADSQTHLHALLERVARSRGG